MFFSNGYVGKQFKSSDLMFCWLWHLVNIKVCRQVIKNVKIVILDKIGGNIGVATIMQLIIPSPLSCCVCSLSPSVNNATGERD